MLIDIGFLLVVAFAIFKGYGKGFIVAVFSFAALFIGLAAALKLSSTVADHLHSQTHLNGFWLPALSFAIVFGLAIFAIRFAAVLIKKMAGLVLLGPADSIAGVVLFVLIYLMIYSIVLFYATNLHIISKEAQQASVTHSFIAPFGPKVISWVGVLIPFFKDMFSTLASFFGSFASKP